MRRGGIAAPRPGPGGRSPAAPRRRPGRGCGLVGVVLGAAAAFACAAPGLTPRGIGEPAVERADAPPEYDFLVGREHELADRPVEALAAYRRALEKDPDAVALHKKVAELLARQGQVAEALAHAERAHALDAEDEGVRLFLGTLYRLRRDVAAAERVLRAEDGTPRGTDAAFLLYGAYSDAGRLEEALAMAQWILHEQPADLRGSFALAAVQEQLGRPEEAEATLRAALEHHPRSLAVYGAMARNRRERGDRPGEIEIYREVLRQHPHHHATLGALAEAQIDAGLLPEARETLAEIEALYPHDLRSVVRLGFLELEARDYDAAAERFEAALRANPEQYEIAYFLGVVHRRAGRLDVALEVLERIPEDHERYADARSQLAAIYERRGEYVQALAEAERARARHPSRELDLYVASLRARAGDFEGAVAFLTDLLAAAPDDPELFYNLGMLYGEAGRIDEALAYMRQALEKDPKHAGALNYIGYTFAERGINLDEAEALIVRALELRPDDGYITDSLGWVYYMRARPLLEAGQVEAGRSLLERAIRELERAAELTGGDPVVAEHLGDAYLLLEERRRALEMYERALELEPREDEQPDLRDKLERLRRELEGR